MTDEVLKTAKKIFNWMKGDEEDVKIILDQEIYHIKKHVVQHMLDIFVLIYGMVKNIFFK